MYEVHIFYQGIDTYVVYKDGEEIYFGWSPDEIHKLTGVHVDDMKRI